jgi:hypothetical protein
MLMLNGNDDLTFVELLMSVDSNSEIADYCQTLWPGKAGASRRGGGGASIRARARGAVVAAVPRAGCGGRGTSGHGAC